MHFLLTYMSRKKMSKHLGKLYEYWKLIFIYSFV